VQRRRVFIALLALPWLVTLAVAVVVVRAWRESGGDLPVIDAPAAGETPWRHEKHTVVDPVVGFRPRRDYVARLRMGPLGGERVRHRRRQNNLGLIRAEDVQSLPDARRVLLLGDSHMMGVVDNADNASDVLERALRERSGDPNAAVYNGGCANYSLYQYVLRARTLVDVLRPDTLVAVIFLGNDLLELEDVERPHLDDALVERPARSDAPPPLAMERWDALGQPSQNLFWQGLNQAAYLRDSPRRFRPVLAKARRSLELLAALAKRRQMPLIVALLPSYDLVFPERAAAESPGVRDLVAGNPNVNVRAGLLAMLAELGIPYVDLVEPFRADGRDALYALDYHIYVEGPRLLAEALLPSVLAAAPGRGR
jgi:lysophospholipase L1-like esterase